MVPIAYMPSPIPRQVGWNLFARTIPFASAFPRNRGGSAPASLFSGPAQRSLTLRPTRSPSHLSDPLHQRLQQSRCLHCCSDCYRVERTSSRAGIPPLWTSAFTAHTRIPFIRTWPLETLEDTGHLWANLSRSDCRYLIQLPPQTSSWELQAPERESSYRAAASSQ